MSVTVYNVNPADSGFGMFQRSVEGETFPDLESVADYIALAQQENVDLERITEDDPDWLLVEAANGNTYDQNGGVIVGWRCGGVIELYLVCVS